MGKDTVAKVVAGTMMAVALGIAAVSLGMSSPAAASLSTGSFVPESFGCDEPCPPGEICCKNGARAACLPPDECEAMGGHKVPNK